MEELKEVLVVQVGHGSCFCRELSKFVQVLLEVRAYKARVYQMCRQNCPKRVCQAMGSGQVE